MEGEEVGLGAGCTDLGLCECGLFVSDDIGESVRIKYHMHTSLCTGGCVIGGRIIRMCGVV